MLVASEYFASRKLKAFPVIHDDGTLAGTVDVALFSDQIISVARRPRRNLSTARRPCDVDGNSVDVVRDRFPWLLSNISGGLLCAFIASQFEELLQQVVVLALFIPVVLALAESVSMQSATLTLQSLSDEALRPRRVLAALWRETRTAILLGLSAAAIVGLAVLAWRRDVMGALVIGGAISAAILAACFFDAPADDRPGRQGGPTDCGRPMVLASTDLVTLVTYLWLGSVVLEVETCSNAPHHVRLMRGHRYSGRVTCEERSRSCRRGVVACHPHTVANEPPTPPAVVVSGIVIDDRTNGRLPARSSTSKASRLPRQPMPMGASR